MEFYHYIINNVMIKRLLATINYYHYMRKLAEIKKTQ